MSKKYEPFGKYVLLEKLATGGMAEVYLAKSESAEGISKFIAVKRILPQYSDQHEFIEMFKDEAKIAINLNHNNIVSIYEFGVEAEQFFLVMDYVEGRNVRQVLNKMKKLKRSFAIEQIAYMVKEVAAGLEHAHRCLDGATGRPLNITHRDISPQNIMLSFEGEIKVVDFGIAKAESKLENTRAGTLKGKFSYMSPEQASGQPLDLRTDIFSLGIVFWELLANERLFTASNEINTLRKVKECKIPSLRAMNPNIPAELEQIVGKALAKDRSLRYQTAATLYRDLNRFLNRHYPDFSTHDFASFIKSLYSDEIIEHRKKMIEYAKVSIGDLRASQPGANPDPNKAQPERKPLIRNQPMEPSQSFFVFDPDDDNNVPQLASNSAPHAAPEPSHNPKNALETEDDAPLSFSDNEIRAIRRASRETQTGSAKRVDYDDFSSSYTRGHTGTYQSASLKRQRKSSLFPMLVLIAVIAGGLYFLTGNNLNIEKITWLSGFPSLPLAEPPSDRPGTTNPNTVPQTNPDWLYHLSVDSYPKGARILINEKESGQSTPAIVKVPVNKPFKLSLKKIGYHTIERWMTQKEPTAKFSTVLAVQPMAYVKVIVPIGAHRLIINNETYEYDRNRQYAIPANVVVKIVAVGLTGGTDEQTVTIGPDRSREIYLNPDASKR